MSIESLIRDIKNSVVKVCSDDGAGTGFAVSLKGHILTCAHVLVNDRVLIITENGDRHYGEILGKDEKSDLAILHIENWGGSPLTFADPATLTEGQTVYALGHPLGLDFTVSRGIISNKQRIKHGISLVQTDVSLNPGNSGCPVINEQGETVGVASRVIEGGQGLGFAIALQHIFAFTSQMRIPIHKAEQFRVLNL